MAVEIWQLRFAVEICVGVFEIGVGVEISELGFLRFVLAVELDF